MGIFLQIRLPSFSLRIVCDSNRFQESITCAVTPAVQAHWSFWQFPLAQLGSISFAVPTGARAERTFEGKDVVRTVRRPAEIAPFVFVFAVVAATAVLTNASGAVDSSATANVQEQSQSIKSRAGEVLVPVTVVNRQGEVVLNLSKEDFRIYDDGVEQQIELFDLGGDPVSIAFVVQTSSDISALLPGIRRLGIIFSQVVMTSVGEAAVIGFDNTVDVLEPFTTDQDVVQKSIEQLKTGTSGSKLYDAMSRGLSLLERLPPGRRRVLVVTADSHDRGSQTKLEEVLWQATLANTTIYSVGLSTSAAAFRKKPEPFLTPNVGPPSAVLPIPGFQFNGCGFEVQCIGQSQLYREAVPGNIDLSAVAGLIANISTTPNALAAASEATGGLHVNTKSDPSIQQAMDQIGGELSCQYMLAYHPSEGDRSGYHRIKVEVNRPDVIVRTRPGYFVGPTF